MYRPIGLHAKHRLFLSDFNETTIFLMDFRKFHKNPPTASRAVPCGLTDGQTDITKLIVAFHNFPKAPKNTWHGKVSALILDVPFSNLGPDTGCPRFSVCFPRPLDFNAGSVSNLKWGHANVFTPWHLILYSLIILSYGATNLRCWPCCQTNLTNKSLTCTSICFPHVTPKSVSLINMIHVSARLIR
jgi:hypothetical protein